MTGETKQRKINKGNKILEYWKENDIYRKVKEKNKDKKIWYFCEGPPYATGDPHPGTLWNRVMKDMILRYKRYNGYNVHDRAGYDTHGLPIEVKVEKELKFKGKKDIEKYGVDKFIKKCKAFATKYIDSMSEKVISYGVWLDFDHYYATYRESYMNKVWSFIKKAYDKGLLYEGDYVVPYCPRCQTTLANYELNYFEKEDPSIFVKFKVRDKENEYLIIWTTTPWTLVSNMAVMVHPSFTYVKVKVDDEIWIIAKERVDYLMNLINKPVIIVNEMSGKRLDGTRYEHPLQDLIGKQYDRKVVLSDEYVTLEDGSGLVHTAPGHGPEDYIIGKRYGLEIYSPVTKEGKFDDTAGKYKGIEVLKANPIVMEDLKKVGALVHASTIKHRYPRCWRCKTPLIYINMNQWFIKISELREDMLANIENNVNWIPDFLKKRMVDFVGEAPDWCISRQRYWGIPLPIWRCDKCGAIKVFGNSNELPEKPKDMHKPWIDDISFKCDKCDGMMRRVPDVLDVWIDSGNAIWASLTDEESKDSQYKEAEFIIEGRDQVRGWFYSLLGSGMIYLGHAPYKNVMMHGFFLNEKGLEMSKSLGNFVSIEEILEKYGADPFRLWSLKNVPWEDIKFSWRELKEASNELNIIRNMGVFLTRFTPDEYIDPTRLDIDKLSIEDRWLLSRYNTVVKEFNTYMDRYELHLATRKLKSFLIDDVSRLYIKVIKTRVKESEDKDIALSTLRYVFFNSLKLLSIIVPFTSEQIYLDTFKDKIDDEHYDKESIYLYDWPQSDITHIDKLLENGMQIMEEIVTTVGNLRQQAGIKLRWPIEEEIIVSDDTEVENTVDKLRMLLKNMTNCENINFTRDFITDYTVFVDEDVITHEFGDQATHIIELIKKSNPADLQRQLELSGVIKIDGFDIDKGVKVNEDAGEYIGMWMQHAKIYIKKKLTEELELKGLLREVIRRIQIMRKKNRLIETDRIELEIFAEKKLKKAITEHKGQLMSKVGADKVRLITAKDLEDGRVKEPKESWEIEGMKLGINIRKH
ncbi:isoleucine--tRNA ligase [Candidatus Micrarchaeota archaeon]|nr:isoleucine--tRNA ligase [Candidatus Micrarchaeota archaeon]